MPSVGGSSPPGDRATDQQQHDRASDGGEPVLKCPKLVDRIAKANRLGDEVAHAPCVLLSTLRPERAAGAPSSRRLACASASVTSSSTLPRRASLKLMRTFAPLPSSIASPERSDTKRVFRATGSPLVVCPRS